MKQTSLFILNIVMLVTLSLSAEFCSVADAVLQHGGRTSHAWSWSVDFDRGHRRRLRWRRWQRFQMRRQFTMSMIVPVARNIGT